MKNKLLIIIAIISATGLGSCKREFLNEIPVTNLTSASFFKNESQFNQALVGAYSNLRLIPIVGIFMDEMRSDNTFFTIYSGDRSTFLGVESIAEFMDDANVNENNNAGDRYGNDYSGIARVNTILSRIKNTDIPQPAQDKIVGEALFLRAFYYYDLVQHYGGVPLQLEELTSEEGAFIPRNTVDEVYAQIIKDLTEAIPKLPVAATFPQSGRATRGAAKMLLAYAYMSKPTREYVKAETELLDITKMNYALLPNYADVFDPKNKNNKESIFEIQYMAGNDGMQSDFIWRFIPKTTNTEVILGLRGTNLRGGLRSGGWNVPTQEMVDSYEPGDLRLPASIGVAEGTQVVETFTTTAVKSPVGYTPTAGKTYYYFIKKYLHPPYTVEWNTNNNWPVFRYAGALLLLAENLVEQGRSAEALPYLNQVRRRAGLPDLSVATKENVANEMRHELAFENHRWMDLIRTGKAIEVMKKFGATMKSLYGWLLPSAFNDIGPHRLIYPIPSRELRINSTLTQNPGY